MSNVMGTIGARSNIRIYPAQNPENKSSKLPRDVRDVKDRKKYELIEENEQYFLVSGFDLQTLEYEEKIPVSHGEDTYKKSVPRAHIMDIALDNLDKDKRAFLHKGDKKKRKTQKISRAKRERARKKKLAHDIGLDLDEVESKEEWLNDKWQSNEPVTRKEVRLLNLMLSELTVVGPFPVDFKEMKTRWASFRYKSGRISYSEIDKDICREWYWYLLCHEYSHATRPNGSDESTHGEEFKERENRLLEGLGLRAVYKSEKSGNLVRLETIDGELICYEDGVEPDEDIVDTDTGLCKI